MTKVTLKVQTITGNVISIETAVQDYTNALQRLALLNGLYLGSVFVPKDNIVAILAEEKKAEDDENTISKSEGETTTKSGKKPSK